MEKKTDIQVQEAQAVPKRISPERNIARHAVSSLGEVRGGALKAARWVQGSSCKTVRWFLRNCRPERSGRIYLKG